MQNVTLFKQAFVSLDTIFSPGKLYGGLSIADLSTDHYQSRLRNKLIAEAFYLTKNIEKYGSGVLITFGQGGGASGGVSGVIDFIRMKPGVKTTEIIKGLDIPKRTLERWIKQLRDEKRIIFKGSAKTGSYYVTEGEVNP